MGNPWGTFEWEGDWGDTSDMWKKHPKVKRELKPDTGAPDDGIFWIGWEDFMKNYTSVDVCKRTTGLRDLALDIHEDAGCIGPCKGCVGGCLSYYCCCAGCIALCCGKESDDKTVDVSSGCCC